LPLNELQRHIGAVHAHLASAPLRKPAPMATAAAAAALPERGDEQQHRG
jgi:hypothetical protein